MHAWRRCSLRRRRHFRKSITTESTESTESTEESTDISCISSGFSVPLWFKLLVHTDEKSSIGGLFQTKSGEKQRQMAIYAKICGESRSRRHHTRAIC